MLTTTEGQTMATVATYKSGRMNEVIFRKLPNSLSMSGRWALLVGVLFGAVMVAASAIIHLHLWLQGYRHIHLIGPAFLFQVISGLVLAVVLVAYRRMVTLLAGAAFCGGSAIALILSATVGFLGLHDGLGVPWAAWALVTELAGFVVLAACAGVTMWRR
jgi:hypothetical protein